MQPQYLCWDGKVSQGVSVQDVSASIVEQDIRGEFVQRSFQVISE